jgi:hypothetical protein
MNDGELGGGLLKKRIARSGAGKRGGYRTIVAFRVKKRAVFIYGFAKSSVDNLDELELRGYRKLAQIMLGFSDAAVENALDIGELREVDYNAGEI